MPSVVPSSSGRPVEPILCDVEPSTAISSSIAVKVVLKVGEPSSFSFFVCREAPRRIGGSTGGCDLGYDDSREPAGCAVKVLVSFPIVGEDKYMRDGCGEVETGVPLRLARNLLNIGGKGDCDREAADNAALEDRQSCFIEVRIPTANHGELWEKA